jgi:uncharacterized repeat protein (TIGR03803 family)
VLYGSTFYGGDSTCLSGGCGTVFAVSTSGAERVLHRFKGSDGAWLYGGFIADVNGTLYSTTRQGGAIRCIHHQGCGTVFKMTRSGTETILYNFKGDPDATWPLAGLSHANGTLYGTTFRGGAKRGGTVFQLDSSGAERVLYSFEYNNNTDGYQPVGAPTVIGGTLYGVTSLGNGGTVFELSTTGSKTILYSFIGGSDGSNPFAGLIDVGGTLYGTTLQGGGSGCSYAHGCGTVFKMSTSGTESVLYRFVGGTDGADPEADLLDINGTLYGTTVSGGGVNTCSYNWSYGCGTVFKINPVGMETVLHVFAGGSDGAYPFSNLIDVNGTLYGTTSGGGTSAKCSGGCGTVFSIGL